MMSIFRLLPAFALFSILSTVSIGYAQSKNKKGIFVDSKGIIRWQGSKKEAAFFGVNYTVPFAYGYRSHNSLAIDHEKAIQQDVYHMARLGIDAFRVHVWDTEITDSAGNLLQNEHLRLFDFLIAELKKRNIKILVTPIAFWGNGYPERDERTPGFSAKYGKDKALIDEGAIKAQENYLKQFFKHVNPYTKTSYFQDEDILASEINNEPNHSGSKNFAKDYINRLVSAIRGTGWSKPIFYNISQSPSYAEAVAGGNIDGVSFQWYPTELVSNQTLHGNYLPNVDRYAIPFDTIASFNSKAKMIYEFDAADVMKPIMYPAMARSFRTAGFQWATQFAYDPLATAYANTEYQTHYLNLIYTPAKAISLLIATKIFHQVPLHKNYGSYPANTRFETFRLTYQESLSEMNSVKEFYYSNSTTSKPVSATKLQKIAGVGSSGVVQYSGKGAYFLDKLKDGVWRLEVMPDAIPVRDPFERTSLKKEVTRIVWGLQEMNISLPDLGSDFEIKPLNQSNTYSAKAVGSGFTIFPGSYLLVSKSKSKVSVNPSMKLGTICMNEFVAPKPYTADVALLHQPNLEVIAGQAFKIKASVVGLYKNDYVMLHVGQLGGKRASVEMRPTSSYDYEAEIPQNLVEPGLINYRIAIRQGDSTISFPRDQKGRADGSNSSSYPTWQTYVASSLSSLELYNSNSDQNIHVLAKWNKKLETKYIVHDKGKQLLYRVYLPVRTGDTIVGFQTFVADKLLGRISESESFKSVSIKAKCVDSQATRLKITLLDKEGQAYSALVKLDFELMEMNIPLEHFKVSSSLLLPRPYPAFQPLWFTQSKQNNVRLSQIEFLQVSVNPGKTDSVEHKGFGFELESIELKK